MSFLSNMDKKQKVFFTIFVGFVIIAIIVLVLFTVNKNKKAEESVPTYHSKYANVQWIDDVNDENTKLNISTTEETEEVMIELEEKIEDYNLYYLVASYANTDKIIDKFDFYDYQKYYEPIHIEENGKVYFIYEKHGKYSKDVYQIDINNIVKSLQDSEEVSEEQLEAEQVDPNQKSNATYYIKVNYGANAVTVYKKDGDGNYTVPVKAMVCSCGKATPKSGVYKTSKGYTWGSLIGGVYGQYSTRIVGSILFHSVPYTASSKDTLEYWEFDKLGTTASAGCVRLMVEDAKWIFYNCEVGTMVEFYSDADPGPLGKPSAPKISDNEECRNWDPTDDDPSNPWKNQNIEDFIEENTEEETEPEEDVSGIDKNNINYNFPGTRD